MCAKAVGCRRLGCVQRNNAVFGQRFLPLPVRTSADLRLPASGHWYRQPARFNGVALKRSMMSINMPGLVCDVRCRRRCAGKTKCRRCMCHLLEQQGGAFSRCISVGSLHGKVFAADTGLVGGHGDGVACRKRRWHPSAFDGIHSSTDLTKIVAVLINDAVAVEDDEFHGGGSYFSVFKLLCHFSRPSEKTGVRLAKVSGCFDVVKPPSEGVSRSVVFHKGAMAVNFFVGVVELSKPLAEFGKSRPPSMRRPCV